ncbi:MAG: mannitol-1-phosphate 5-dehydrogenase [Armatimonadota bacterium]
MKTAVQFGAGSIGRGFMGQLFSESGYEVVFVDVVQEIVDELNRRHSYPLRIAGETIEELVIPNVRAVDARNESAVAEEVRRASIICTAVGASALPAVARVLAKGLSSRSDPVNIIICENLPRPAETVRELLLNNTPPERRAFVEKNVGLVEAVVARMVPVQDRSPGADPLAVTVEPYKLLPVNAQGFVGPPPQIVGMEPKPNFRAYVERKLFAHNAGHAAAAYLGYLRGYAFIYEVMRDAELQEKVRGAMHETGHALIKKHGFDPDEHNEHIEDLLRRFANVPLGDTVARVGRDPIRKLARDDRLVGGALLAMEYGATPCKLAEAIAAALFFDVPGDPSARTLQSMLRDRGIDAVLRDICGLDRGHPLSALVKQAWMSLQASRSA